MNKSRLTPTAPGLSAAVASVLSTNLGTKMPNPTGKGTTGINKQSVGSLDVFAPAPGYGNGSGVIRDFVGDAITFLPAPDHEVTMGQAFAAAMGDRAAMQAVVETGCYPPFYHDRLLAKLGR